MACGFIPYRCSKQSKKDRIRNPKKNMFTNFLLYYSRGPDKLSVQLGIYPTSFLAIAFFQKRIP